MRAKTHPGGDKRVETSASDEAVDVKDTEQKGLASRDKANRELASSGLTPDEVAQQSAYRQDQFEAADQIADSERKG